MNKEELMRIKKAMKEAEPEHAQSLLKTKDEKVNFIPVFTNIEMKTDPAQIAVNQDPMANILNSDNPKLNEQEV